VEYVVTLCKRLSAKEDKWNLVKILALRDKGDIEDYMIQKTYYNTNLGINSPARGTQIGLDLLC
jgi:hypothetical protein